MRYNSAANDTFLDLGAVDAIVVLNFANKGEAHAGRQAESDSKRHQHPGRLLVTISLATDTKFRWQRIWLQSNVLFEVLNFILIFSSSFDYVCPSLPLPGN